MKRELEGGRREGGNEETSKKDADNNTNMPNLEIRAEVKRLQLSCSGYVQLWLAHSVESWTDDLQSSGTDNPCLMEVVWCTKYVAPPPHGCRQSPDLDLGEENLNFLVVIVKMTTIVARSVVGFMVLVWAR